MDKNKLRNKLLSKNENYITILNIVGTLIYQGINFILTPYLVRALSVEWFGVISVYTSWITILVPIVSLLTLSVIPHIKLFVEEKDRDKYISSLLGLSLVSFLIIFGLALITLPVLSRALQFSAIVIILLFLQCFGMATVNFAVAFCVQYQKTIYQFLITISLALFTSISSIVMIELISNENLKYMGRIIGYSLPNFAIAILIYISFFKKSKIFYDKAVWKYALPICTPLIFHSLSTVILSQSSRIILQNKLGFETAGLYSFIYTVSSLIAVLWVAVNNAWVPVYYKMLNDNEYEKIYTRGKKYSFFFTSIFCGFMLVAPEILRIMGNPSYSKAIPIMPLISLSMYFIFMYSFSVNYKTICKKTFSIAICTVISAVVNIIANYILIHFYGLWGAAIGTLISYITLFALHQFTVKETELKYIFNLKFFIPTLISALISIAIFYLAFNFWIIRWFVAAIVGVVLLTKTIKQRSIF